MRAIPGVGHAVEPDLGIDIQVAALKRGQGGQGFRRQGFGLATVALFHDETFDINQNQVGFPVHGAEIDRALDFAFRGVGGLGRSGKCKQDGRGGQGLDRGKTHWLFASIGSRTHARPGLEVPWS
ncbi:hypothetical protein D3C72_1578750 [compost metagenome]